MFQRTLTLPLPVGANVCMFLCGPGSCAADWCVSGAFGPDREGARAPPAGGAHSGAREEPESGAAWESRWCGSRTANILCRATRHALRAALAALHHGVQLALEGVRAHALHVDSLLHAEL